MVDVQAGAVLGVDQGFGQVVDVGQVLGGACERDHAQMEEQLGDGHGRVCPWMTVKSPASNRACATASARLVGPNTRTGGVTLVSTTTYFPRWSSSLTTTQ